ncbi:hypothetical protein COOONC_07419 [Cooperia oncophora]
MAQSFMMSNCLQPNCCCCPVPYLVPIPCLVPVPEKKVETTAAPQPQFCCCFLTNPGQGAATTAAPPIGVPDIILGACELQVEDEAAQ